MNVSAGYDHSVILMSDGTVWTCGDNSYGQLGNGSDVMLTGTPVRVYGLTGVTAISAGWYHTVALKSDGSVWSWGRNNYGQLGDGTTVNRSTPVRVLGVSGVNAIAAGGLHTVMMKSDGTLWSCGCNMEGELGYGTLDYYQAYPFPAKVTVISDVAAFDAGNEYTVVLKKDGTVWSWGNASFGHLGNGDDKPFYCKTTPVQASGLSGVKAIAAKFDHTVALKTDGTVWAWGKNYTGQIGNGECQTDSFLTPVQVSGINDVKAITTGGRHTVAVKSDGTLWGWGDDGNSEFGDVGGVGYYVCSPRQISGFNNAASVSAGYMHTLVTRTDGSVCACGSNIYGQLGNGTTCIKPNPIEVAGISQAVGIAANGRYSIAIMQDGTLQAWGERYAKTPQSVAGIDGVVKVAAGDSHTVALKSDSTVWTWGSNSDGELGNTSENSRYTPAPISGFSGAADISAGMNHTMVLKSDGTVWTCGNNMWGQLGDGTTNARYSLVCVPALTDVKAIAAGDYFSVAVKRNGTVWTWGDNGTGQLGDGSTTQRNLPVQVSGLSDVTAVTAGDGYAVALKSDGTVWAWGSNSEGNLGDGTWTERKVPVQVTGLSGIVAIAAGWCHTLALSRDGTVWSWGSNDDGQLGDGTLTVRRVPVQVPGVTGITAVAAGDSHSLALRSDNAVIGWGLDDSSQLGDNPVVDSLPAPILGLNSGPLVASVTINDGAAATGSASVHIGLRSTGSSAPSEVRISNDGVFDTEPWVPYAESIEWTLSPSEGTKTVYVRLRDANGIESDVATASIILDTAAPVINSVIVKPAIVATGDTIHITASLLDFAGISSVTVGGIVLNQTLPGTWEGDMTAASKLGRYDLTVSASDVLGHSMTKQSGSYLVAPIVAIAGKGITNKIITTACSAWLFRVCGKVTSIAYADGHVFDLDNGSGIKVRVILSAPIEISQGDYISVRGILHENGNSPWFESEPKYVTKYN